MAHFPLHQIFWEPYFFPVQTIVRPLTSLAFGAARDMAQQVAAELQTLKKRDMDEKQRTRYGAPDVILYVLVI